jgi:hypothetical protein
VNVLRDRNTELSRKCAIAEAEAASLRAQLKTAETAIHKLKDDAAKMKTMVAQTRSACANEVRKRDRQIDGLKKAVSEAGRARGTRSNGGITTITVTGDIGGDTVQGTSKHETMGDGYDLRQETNSFLAELAKGLSEENETLLGLVRRTKDSLKDMSGLAERDVVVGDGHATTLAVTPGEMAGEIEGILEHLRTILTNPSFVPIEEVVVREDEINRLRDGWEKMETRWSEAVHLMDGWRRRMQADGRPVNMEELKMGLRLSPVRVRNVAETAQNLGLRLAAVEEEMEDDSRLRLPTPEHSSLHLVPAPELEEAELDGSDDESSILVDDMDVNDLDLEEPNVQVLQHSAMLNSMDSSPLPPPPELSPLKDNYSAGNRGEPELSPFKRATRERPTDFTTIIEENTCELRQEEAQAPEPPPHRTKPLPPRRQEGRPTKPDTPPSSVTSSEKRESPGSITLVKSEEDDSVSKPARAPTARSRPIVTRRATRPGRSEPTTRPPTTRPAAARTTRIAAEPDKEKPTRATRTVREPEPEKPAKAIRTTKQPEQRQAPTSKSRPLRSKPSRPDLQRESESSPTAPLPSSSSKPTTADCTTSSTSTTSAATSNSATSTASNKTVRPVSPVKPPGSPTRLPMPRNGASILPPPVQSPLTMATIAAKLAASEKEADAARVRAKLRAMKLARGKKDDADGQGGEQRELETNRDANNRSIKTVAAEEVLEQRTGSETAGNGDGKADLVVEKPRKRERELGRRTGKVASRRRSTLNPQELKSLIQGDVNVDLA